MEVKAPRADRASAVTDTQTAAIDRAQEQPGEGELAIKRHTDGCEILIPLIGSRQLNTTCGLKSLIRFMTAGMSSWTQHASTLWPSTFSALNTSASVMVGRAKPTNFNGLTCLPFRTVEDDQDAHTILPQPIQRSEELRFDEIVEFLGSPQSIVAVEGD